MSIKKLCFLISAIFFVFINVNIFGQNAQNANNLQSIILEDFELGQDGKPVRLWTVVPDRFGRKDNKDSGTSLQDIKWVKAWPESYFGLENAGGKGEFFFGPDSSADAATKKKYSETSGTSLGLKLAFNRQGYNSVEVYPLAEKNGKLEYTPIPFKGKVKQFDMWIWGANYDYKVEMVLVDFKGYEWRLDVGSIKHIGWKDFTVQIPNYIPQSVNYVPSTKTLSFVKFVIWTTPNEKITGAYVYFDHIKYLTDVFNELYDGYQLGDPNYTESIWKKGASGPSVDK